MRDILKMLFRSLAVDMISRSLHSAVEIAEIKAVSIYLRIVDGVRKSVAAMVALFLVMLLLLVGFVALHVGVFIVSGWELRTIGIITLALGGIYGFVAALIILWITSEKTWMKLSHGSELVDKVTKQH